MAVSMILGITGKIGVGKHQVAKLFVEKGFTLIEADKIAHSLYFRGSKLWHKIVDSFGKKILTQELEINRQKLAKLVFSNPKHLATLNQIIHPVLKLKLKSVVSNLIRKKTKNIVILVALADELALRSLVDKIILITAPFDLKANWLEKNRKMSLAEIQARDAFQKDTQDYDFLIENQGKIEDLQKKISILFTNIFI